jgi:hypothetical protein
LASGAPANVSGFSAKHVRTTARISYYLNTEASEITEEAVRQTFRNWETFTHFRFVYMGRNRAGLLRDGKNTVSFLVQWPKNLSSSKLAYCMNWYDAQGNTIESDIILNMAVAGFTTARTNRPGAYYIEGVLAHEIGHMIGLDHIEDVGCLMKAYSPLAESYGRARIDSRTIEAYRSLYPETMAGLTNSGG